jgi:ribosomal-protein-alanine N-acetyltransferase
MDVNKLSQGFYFEGHTIALRQPLEADLTIGTWSSWYNDYSVTRYNSHGVYPVSIEDELQYVKDKIGRRDCLIFSIINKTSGELIGNTALQNIDYINRKCNIALTIGTPLGISTAVEVFGLLLEHAFARLNLNRVGDATHEKLKSLVKMLGVLGFKEEGCSKEFFLRDGEFSNAIHFGVLSKDYFSLREARKGNILFDDLDRLNEAIVELMR